MVEVGNIEDAKSAIVISEAFGNKNILKEIYFDGSEKLSEMLRHVVNSYPEFINYNNRIDLYRVVNGRKIARI